MPPGTAISRFASDQPQNLVYNKASFGVFSRAEGEGGEEEEYLQQEVATEEIKTDLVSVVAVKKKGRHEEGEGGRGGRRGQE